MSSTARAIASDFTRQPKNVLTTSPSPQIFDMAPLLKVTALRLHGGVAAGDRARAARDGC